MQRGVAAIERRIRNLDTHRAPFGHGVARIEREVQDRIFELAGIYGGVPGLQGGVHFERDALAQRMLEQTREVRDQARDGGRPGGKRLAPRKGQELLRQPCAAVGGGGSAVAGRATAPALSDTSARTRSRLACTICRMLLKSCAMPPVSWPTASIFWP